MFLKSYHWNEYAVKAEAAAQPKRHCLDEALLRLVIISAERSTRLEDRLSQRLLLSKPSGSAAIGRRSCYNVVRPGRRLGTGSRGIGTMNAEFFISALATLVAVVFAGFVFFGQYRRRRRPHQLVWSIALVIFGVATGCQALAAVGGWSAGLYRVWYLSGAVLGVVYLGLGTIYLMAPRRLADLLTGAVVLASLVAGWLVAAAPVDLDLALQAGSISGAGMPQSVRLLTPIFNSLGTVALIGGALHSAWVFHRKGLYPHRVIANVVIAVGAFIVALGGTLSRLGRPEYMYLSELVGIAVLFVGFLKSAEQPRSEPATQQRPMGVR